MQEQLRLIINQFEKKIDRVEEDYKEKHKKHVNYQKMKNHVDKKLSKEIKMLIGINFMKFQSSVLKEQLDNNIKEMVDVVKDFRLSLSKRKDVEEE